MIELRPEINFLQTEDDSVISVITLRVIATCDLFFRVEAGQDCVLFHDEFKSEEKKTTGDDEA